MRSFLLSIFLFLFTVTLFAQHTVSGIVRNTAGEKLSFATVFFENTSIAASTDAGGRYVLTNVSPGSYNLKVTFIGYQPVMERIEVRSSVVKDIVMTGEIYNLDQIEIGANRVKQGDPFVSENLGSKELAKENYGVDVPFVLQWLPSLQVTSDAGTGIGYTGLRIRGSDQTRVNVTINGVPLNDAESHNVFWVDLPDLMGSVSSLQVQRGVGPSTNGPGAFGGTISINTNETRVNPYAEVAATLGAFNTRKLSVRSGTGLMNNRYVIDGRYSLIRSDGFIDRATADLESMYLSASRITGKSSLSIKLLHGKETTYQAWYGVPQAKFENDTNALLNHYYNNLGSVYKTAEDSVNLFDSGRSYNYYLYPRQVDNYAQTHLQLHHALSVSPAIRWNSTLYYTRGRGYFEEFRSNDAFENYGMSATDLSGNVLERADLVRRRWLDNDLLGMFSDFEIDIQDRLTLNSGIAANTYIGRHFGQVIQTGIPVLNLDKERRYYENEGQKSDISAYLRAIYSLRSFRFHGDVQLRHIQYEVSGTDNDLREIQVGEPYLFLNPKAGATFRADSLSEWYASVAVAQKEPSRSDFIDNAFGQIPESEKLTNWELGYRRSNKRSMFQTGIYYMDYRNQLVLTGELNDVGAPVRVNVDNSYRLGMETSLDYQLSEKWALHTNLAISTNRINEFNEIIADYTNGFEKVTILHKNTEISFSPPFIAALRLLYKPVRQVEAEFSAKYTSRQYLDNTSDNARKLPAFHYQNARISWMPSSRYWQKLQLSLFVNNVFDVNYASNGYTFSYIYDTLITENYLYPQAGRHWMLTFQATW